MTDGPVRALLGTGTCILTVLLLIAPLCADIPDDESLFEDEDFGAVMTAATRSVIPEAMMTRALTPALAAMAEQVDQITNMADRYRREGNFERAEESLAHFPPDKAGDLDDFSRLALAGANLNLGTSYQKLKRYGNAASAFTRATRFDSTDYRSAYSLGTAYRKQKEYDQAIEALERSIVLNPDFASSHFGLGSVYFKQDSAKKARVAFTNATEKNPTHLAAHFMLGSVAWNEQDYKAAAAAWRRVLEIRPNHAKARTWLAKAEAQVQ